MSTCRAKLLIFCCLTFSSLSGAIVQISTLDLFAQEVTRLDKDSLVVVDVDDTLIFPKDAILRSSSKLTLDQLSQEIAKNVDYATLKKYPLGYLEEKRIPSLKRVPSFLKKLNDPL